VPEEPTELQLAVSTGDDWKLMVTSWTEQTLESAEPVPANKEYWNEKVASG
jgi:hypothetical protein